METVLFWIAWGLISYWALKTFYYSFSKEKIKRLRKAALGINLSVFVLIFLPWLPTSLAGGTSGLTLALQGDVLSVLFIMLLVTSTILFATKDSLLLKFASAANVTNTFLLFVIMHKFRPATFTLSFYDIAPIVAILFLLVGDAIGLLLWRQLQQKERKKYLHAHL